MKLFEDREAFRRACRQIPFVGSLGDCSSKNLTDACKEVAVTTTFATMPLWVLPIVASVFFTDPVSINDSLRIGEIFIYAATLSGPLIYVIFKRYGKLEWEELGSRSRSFPVTFYFPHGLAFLITLIMICFIAGFAMIILKNPHFSHPEDLRRINFNGIVSISWVVFCLVTLLFFCVTAYRNMLEGVGPGQFRREEDDFALRFKAMRGEGR